MKKIYSTLTLFMFLSIFTYAQVDIQNLKLYFNYGTTIYNGGTSFGLSSEMDIKITEKLIFSTTLGYHKGDKTNKARFGLTVDNKFQNYNVNYKGFKENFKFLDLKLLQKLLPSANRSELNVGGGISLSHLSAEYGPLVTYSIEEENIVRELISKDNFLFLFNLAIDYNYKINDRIQIAAGGIARLSPFQNPEISIIENFIGISETNPSVIGSGQFKIGLCYSL